jgi:hypothetical protein
MSVASRIPALPAENGGRPARDESSMATERTACPRLIAPWRKQNNAAVAAEQEETEEERPAEDIYEFLGRKTKDQPIKISYNLTGTVV